MKRFLKISLIFAAVAMVASSCNCYKKMAKKADKVEASCTPSVLSLKGSNVTADIKVTFPPKYFDEATILKITPVLVFDGGEIAGTPKYVQGDRVVDNYTVITWDEGGSYTQTVTFPYDERAKISTLQLKMESKCANPCCKSDEDGVNQFVPFKTVEVAKGISSIQQLANVEDVPYMTMMSDNFKRVSSISQDAQILYQINRSDVRKAELTTDQIKMFEQFVKDYSASQTANLSSVYAKGYASPDGPEKFNDELSAKRSKTGKDALSKQMKDANVKYDVASYGEDWEGFKALVEQSDMQDKELVLKVLEMYSSPAQREKEIHNMSAVFKTLAQDILPQLRRTQFSASANIPGLTDAELKSAATSDIDKLGVEEMLYAATLYSNDADKLKIYAAAAKKYPTEVRVLNNLAVVQARMGQLEEAKKTLAQAAKLQSSSEISNNLGAIALAQGNTAEAQKYLGSLNSKDAQANKALLALEQGDYSKATSGLTGYNLAVDQVLNNNLAAAKQTLANDNSADATYLKAIIAMREGDSKGALANLKSAIAKDPSKKALAQKDIEFAALFGTPEFLAL